MREKDQRLRSKFGRRFDEEFKRDAVSMLESRIRTAEQLAAELGVSVWSLKRWAKVYAKDSAAGGPPGGGGPLAADAAALVLENARLRRELETVSRQRDILKKALGILGQEPPHSTK
ncbi:MAG TPA: transposase [Chthoniobacterales bacterium]|nr:transposase [Chthoniobacterales bacterium]